MAIIFITGSTDGLGHAAAQSLLDDGHQVVLHARSTSRAATIAELAPRSAGIVIGDLRSAAEVRYGPRVDFRYASLATNLAWRHDMSCRAKSLIPKRGVGVELASDYKCMSGMSRRRLEEPLAKSRHLGDPADRTLAAFQEHRLRGNVPHCCQCANHCQVEDTRNACE